MDILMKKQLLKGKEPKFLLMSYIFGGGIGETDIYPYYVTHLPSKKTVH